MWKVEGWERFVDAGMLGIVLWNYDCACEVRYHDTLLVSVSATSNGDLFQFNT